MTIQLHSDRTLPALVHGSRLEWIASPEVGVDRRMLERIGGEVALASTIVRYAPNSRFPSHVHALGEEFIVLSGVFSDESGDYPEGSYVRNPPQSRHAPFSHGGCVIFVKLRQMRDDEPETIRALPHQRDWRVLAHGHRRATLYANGRILVSIDEAIPTSGLQIHSDTGGIEVFVMGGSVTLSTESTALERWSWLRTPAARLEMRAGDNGALVWIKRGHLP